MSIISVRSDCAAGRDGDFVAAAAEVEAGFVGDVTVEWAAATFRKFVVAAVAAGPSLIRLLVGSFRCAACHESGESETTRDKNRKSCRRTERIGFVGWTCRKLNPVVDCI